MVSEVPCEVLHGEAERENLFAKRALHHVSSHFSLRPLCFLLDVVQLSERSFDIFSSLTGRSYHIVDSDAGTVMWTDLINAMLEKQLECSC